LSLIKLLILDVDGVLTTGELPYDAGGNEVKLFYVQDGGAVKRWRAAGGQLAVISGRESPAVLSRAKDLGITSVTQGVADKIGPYEAVCRECCVTDDEVSVVGDALLDIAPMHRCGYPIAVANALPAVKRAARYVTRQYGGRGAVTEAIERLLRHNGTWSDVMSPFVNPGPRPTRLA